LPAGLNLCPQERDLPILPVDDLPQGADGGVLVAFSELFASLFGILFGLFAGVFSLLFGQVNEPFPVDFVGLERAATDAHPHGIHGCAQPFGCVA
jgi:hypothetical protein